MKYIHFFFLLVVFYSCREMNLPEYSASSPDKNITVKFELIESKPCYSIIHSNGSVTEKSFMGFQFSTGEMLDSAFIISSFSEESRDTIWETVWGESKEIRDNYNQFKFSLTHLPTSTVMNIVFRVFNDGAAFRYEFPSLKDSTLITEENTGFSIAKCEGLYWIPADYNSYEKLYSYTNISEAEHIATPATIRYNDSLYCAIHEAALTDYPEMCLRKRTDSYFTADLAPWPDGILVRKYDAFTTPWRVFIIGDCPGKLIESTIILNLNEPCSIENTDWIRPMTYIGIWWGMHIGTHTWTMGERHGATTDEMIKYIDFASANNIGGVLAEGWNTGWENWGKESAFDHITPYADFDLELLADYSRKKNVMIIGHHETGGDILSYEENLDTAFALCNSMGISAVKTGYAGGIIPRGQNHHGQFMVNHYRKVVETAAKYHIMIDAHEPIKATGIRRTWPNMMTREGARGMEWNAWSDGNPPEHTCILPFTRLLAGPMDYTPGIFDVELKNMKDKRVRWNCDDLEKTRVHTTLSKQLALLVILYSPLQMASDLVENYQDHPAFEFIARVPTTWDETKVVCSEIGDFIIMARRKGETWFIAGITDENQRTVKADFSFLKENNYLATIFKDPKNTDYLANPSSYEIIRDSIFQREEIYIEMNAGGGFAMILQPSED